VDEVHEGQYSKIFGAKKGMMNSRNAVLNEKKDLVSDRNLFIRRLQVEKKTKIAECGMKGKNV
jgi:hypothetical protein